MTMPKRESKPKELGKVDINNFPLGECNPLFVAADKVHRVIIGPSKKTWANWRTEKKGPRYFLVGGKPYYKISDLEEYFSQCPVQTIGTFKRNTRHE